MNAAKIDRLRQLVADARRIEAAGQPIARELDAAKANRDALAETGTPQAADETIRALRQQFDALGGEYRAVCDQISRVMDTFFDYGVDPIASAIYEIEDFDAEVAAAKAAAAHEAFAAPEHETVPIGQTMAAPRRAAS